MREKPVHSLSPKALRVFRIQALVYALIVLVVLGAGASFSFFLLEFPWWTFIIACILFMVYVLIMVVYVPKIRYQMWRYDVNEHEVELQYGVFIIKRVLVPMVRVQHVDTSEGPILRKFHLATVTISTAATVHEIPALAVEEADQLRDYISQLAREAKDDV